MKKKILLAGGDFRARALVLAQLQEEGHDVTAVGTWDEAELLLLKRAIRPDAVVLDVGGEGHAEVLLKTFGRLVGLARVLVLTSPSQLADETLRSFGVEHVLARPYSVGDIAAAVAALAI